VKNFKHWTVLVIITYGFIELISYGGLFLLNNYRQIKYEPIDVISTRHSDIINNFIEQKTNYVSYSSSLGWTIKENGSSRLYQANSAGIRSHKEYAFTPPRGIRRISTFGDSYTHCDNVKNNETWQAVLESYDSNREALNFGVGGFGLDQAYLRYLEKGYKYKSHIVLIGFMSENIYRSVNTYRPFYYAKTGVPLTKPRFVVENDELSLIPNPMQKLQDYKTLLHSRDVLSEVGINDYYYNRRYASNIFDWSPNVRLAKILVHKVKKKLHNEDIIINGQYNENAEAFIVIKKIFDEFHNEVIDNGSMPIILVFPNKYDVLQYQRQNEKIYSPLLTFFMSRGYKYIDLMDAFEGAVVKDLFVDHYSPLANMLVAKHIHNYLNNPNSQ
jgi:hypothetical protein